MAIFGNFHTQMNTTYVLYLLLAPQSSFFLRFNFPCCCFKLLSHRSFTIICSITSQSRINFPQLSDIENMSGKMPCKLQNYQLIFTVRTAMFGSNSNLRMIKQAKTVFFLFYLQNRFKHTNVTLLVRKLILQETQKRISRQISQYNRGVMSQQKQCIFFTSDFKQVWCCVFRQGAGALRLRISNNVDAFTS